MSTFTGDMIKKYRTEQGLTQKKLGELCGIADSNIRKYESGRQNPKIETLQKIADALGVPVNRFIARSIVIPVRTPTPEEQRERKQEQKELAFLNKMDSFREKLNDKGQDKAIEQVELLTKIPEYQRKYIEETATILNAAHERTDIETTEEMKKHDDDIMNDENF